MYSASATEYDVFLSFRGLDTRRTFISFLYKELVRRKIRTFKDDEELESGQRISSELNRAIEDSKIAVVVISVNYTASSWCLKELVKIMDFEKKGKKKKKITVMPIFYGMNPCDVRWQINDVAKQFKKHEDREDPGEVSYWKRALTDLANLSGYCSLEWDEAELVDRIADEITKKLIDATSSKPKHLVENGKHMKKIEELLDLNPNEKLRIVGIWARGCKSRKALATNTYHNFNHRFDRHCFLKDVEKISPGRYSAFLHQGFVIERENSSKPKVLLVANNVNGLKQFDALADEFYWFGPGSVVIMTTEDNRLFKSFGINHVYEQEDLRFQEVSAPCRSIPFKKSVILMDTNSPNNVCCLREKEEVKITQEVDSFELFVLGSTWF